MKTKMYIADCNAIIADKFNFAEITLRYADAHKEEEKKGAIYAMITEGTDFICIGMMEGDYRMFKNWEAAAEYAKTLTYKYYIGIRPSGNMKYNIVAICENKAEVMEAAAEDIIAEIIAENKTEYRVHYKTAKNSFYTEVKSIEFKSKDNADKFIAIMKAEGYEIVKWDDESYMGDPKAIAAAKITTYGEVKSLINDEDNAQSEDITEAAPAVEKIVEVIKSHKIKDSVKFTSGSFITNDIMLDGMPEFYVNIYKEHGKYKAFAEIYDCEYNLINKYRFESVWERLSKNAVNEFAAWILAVLQMPQTEEVAVSA